jgi:hypothetical protein
LSKKNLSLYSGLSWNAVLNIITAKVKNSCTTIMTRQPHRRIFMTKPRIRFTFALLEGPMCLDKPEPMLHEDKKSLRSKTEAFSKT